MKPKRQSGFVRFVLRAIDVFVGFYLMRGSRWREEPFRKATDFEKRYGAVFMVVFPALFLTVAIGHKYIDKGLDSMMYGRHSIIWLYVINFLIVGGMGGLLIVIAPKIPLRFSVPVAIIMWVILLWYAWSHLI